MSIPRLFEQQARAHGERVAIHCDRGSTTYADLNRTANALARRILGRQGAGAEPTALLFAHGAEIVAAMLAVLKAGKFYVVLDASYPRERLRQLLSDSGATLIVSGADHLDLAVELAGDAAGVLDCTHRGDERDDDIREIDPLPDDLAMIIYTSGSTGRPKGVMHTHATVLADIRNVSRELSITEHDRWLWQTSVAFGGSARTLFGALLNGSAIYPFDSKKKGFAPLPDWLQRHEITIFRTVPTAFRNFMATLPGGLTFAAVRIVSMGGEPLFRPDVEAFNRHFPPHCVLVHPFGPTETMLVCWTVLRHGQQIPGAKVPIGFTLDGKRVLLLDESRRPVEDGEIGEIAVVSRDLSPGYWRDVEQTRAVFLDDEHGRGERIYLTGDLGMRSSDGTLTHLGRRDHQVKIRGFRIEVAEIETALREIDGIEDVVVVGRASPSGDMRLVAYFVPATSPAIAVTQLREALARRLPDYMIPSIFTALDALPQTATGKTDRLRLPPADRARPEMSVPFTPWTSDIEAALTRIWADVLGLDRLGIHDNLFELGGDSLMATRIVARVKTAFQVDLPLRALFDSPTVAQTANLISRMESAR
ncbi:MAG TPA: non-ribosomal peptide synthetase [Vicinamibacterales bacterium]|nr:non-ribosomal peptide synthetase [Vicinamibacterales bacterium]